MKLWAVLILAAIFTPALMLDHAYATEPTPTCDYVCTLEADLLAANAENATLRAENTSLASDLVIARGDTTGVRLELHMAQQTIAVREATINDLIRKADRLVYRVTVLRARVVMLRAECAA